MTETTTDNPPQDCESVRRLSTPYLDDELAADERKAVEHHLGVCGDCREHFEHEREFDTFLRRSLGAPERDARGSMLEGRVLAALQADTPTPSRARPRPVAAAALLMLGILVGAVGASWYGPFQSGEGDDAELPVRLSEMCDVARDVIPDTRVDGGYEEAAADFRRMFPDNELPRPGAENAPSPRLFGSAAVGDADVHWVVYCTGKEGFPERFVLLTARKSCLDTTLAGLKRLEMDVNDLRMLIWLDQEHYRILVTRREAEWARRQYAALVEA